MYTSQSSLARCVLSSLVMCLIAPSARADEEKPIALDKALTIIQALENRVTTVQWKVECASGKVANINDLSTFVVEPDVGYTRSWVVMDVKSGSYRVNQEAVCPWFKGPASHVAQRLSYSYDGERERELQISSPGKNLPDEKQTGEGHIILPKGDFTKTRNLQAGFAFFPYRFWGERFSSVLKNQSTPPNIIEKPGGLWTIRLLDKYSNTAIVSFDVNKGGIITGIDFCQGSEVPYRQMRVELAEVSAGLWAPKTMWLINPRDRTCERVVYGDVKINHEVPASIYRVHFPPGTRVANVDRGSEVYTESAGPEGDLAAVRGFIEQEGFRYPDTWASDSGSSARGAWFKWAAIGSLLLLGGAFLAWFLRYRRALRLGQRPPLILLLVAGLLFSAGQARSAETPRTLMEPASEEDSPRQCGYCVTAFTLEYFRLSCNSKLVYQALRPTKDGITLADVKRVLLAHGLEVSLRREVSVPELAAALKPNIIAIVPVKSEPSAVGPHYLVAIRHPVRGPLLADVPTRTMDLTKLSDMNRGSDLNGIALFVQSPNGANELGKQLELSVEELDLGSFATDATGSSDSRNLSLKVRNATKNPIMVSGLTVSCDCMTTTWVGGIFEPGEEQEIHFAVSLGRWPNGKAQKHVDLVLGDRSIRHFVVKGEHVTSQEAQGVVLDTPAIRFEVSELGKEAVRLEKDVGVNVGSVPESELTLTSSAAWLSAEVVRTGPHALLRVRATVNQDLLLRDSNAEGRIMLSTRKGIPPACLRVDVWRKDFFVLPRETVVVCRRGEGPQKARLVPQEGLTRRLHVLKVEDDAPGPLATAHENSDGTVILEFERRANTPRGTYLVRCILESERQQQGTASFVVRVED